MFQRLFADRFKLTVHWESRDFPVTLYKEQWLRILASAAEIETFIRENDSKLKPKE
jgi:hypothetical protein